jgi:hypothetical protein
MNSGSIARPSGPGSPSRAESETQSATHAAGGAVRFGDLNIAEVRGVSMVGLCLDAGTSEATATIERITVDYLAARRGTIAFTMSDVLLRNVKARFADCTLDLARLRGCDVAELQVGRVGAVIRELSGDDAHQVVHGPLRLDALRGAQGLLRTFMKDALWRIDVEAIVPIANGGVKLASIDVNHVGPDSRIGPGPMGIYVYPPTGGAIELLRFSSADLNPANGTVDLASLIEHALRSASADSIATLDERMRPAVARLRLDGHVRLGDGALGDGPRHVVLSSSDPQANRIDLASPALAEQLTFRLARLVASSLAAAFGPLAAQAADLRATIEGRALPMQGQGGGGRIRLNLELLATQVQCRNVRVAAAQESDKA